MCDTRPEWALKVDADLSVLADECHYSDEGGFDDEGNDLGSVDSLIDYKNALEEKVYDLSRELHEKVSA